MTANSVLKFVRSVLRGDRRRASRYDVALADGIVTGAHTSAVTIRDLSLTGALIEGAGLPPAGAAVTLARGSFTVAATVAWADEARAGLTFDRPLPAEQLFTIVHSAQYRSGKGVPAALAA
jgi:hypothetical protein